MLFALVKNTLSPPSKGLNGKCPLCSESVISRCGEVNLHHWSHKKGTECDGWTEQETFWHKSWKECFPQRNREVIFEKQNKKHFADIYTDDGIIIELQNSSISLETINQREIFYGEKMLWIINGSKYRYRISIFRTSAINTIINNKNIPNTSLHRYYSNYVNLADQNINEFISTGNEFQFHWEYPIRSWRNTQRPVFLDIGEDYILWIKKGIGINYGSLKVFSKEKFFRKYKGDYSKYLELNCHKNLNYYQSIIRSLDTGIENWFDRQNWDQKGFNYPLGLYTRVYDSYSAKSNVRKLRWEEPMVPNSNSKGVLFLFCYKIEQPEEYGVLIREALNNNFGKEFMLLSKKDISKEQFTANDSQWVIEYLASIPIKQELLNSAASSLVNYLIENVDTPIINKTLF